MWRVLCGTRAVNQEGAAFVDGKTVEKDNEYVCVKGWESVEAHKAAGIVTPKALEQLVTSEVVHVRLIAYNGST
ncbi:hypothetical protein EUX98_g3428 [Antrodiella citrinella]|uniref:Uncharacterized protein n=1 Tax=Antrodiella citrinella TaxID=2447956 RepID=A0A4S4MYN3_9APHY|nr:hypothetical protein EUX98_g3428 [Antrodiella citrinella]